MPARHTAVLLAGFGLVLSIVFVSRRPATAQNESPGRKLAFLVGVKTYDHGSLRDLDFPENDVMELADVLRAQQFEVVVLTTTLAKNDSTLEPTAENIRKRLTGLLEQRRVTKHDVILIGLAGHGMQPLGSKEAYFCPRDANPTTDGSNPTKPKTLVALGEILKQVDDSGVGHKLLLVDACRNDPNVRGRRGVERVDVSALPPQTGVLLSCGPGEFSFEHKSFGTGHGAFFFEVIEGLKGAAKDEDGEITWESLRAFVRKHVAAKVREVFGRDGGEQRPNEIGNLIGEPTVLAVARAITTPSRLERKTEPSEVMPKTAEPAPQSADAFAGTRAGQTRNDNGLKTTLVWIPPGEFTMGSPKDEKGHNENEHQVQVTLTRGFWLGQHEVTQAEWQRLMQTAPWSGKDSVKEGDNYPATYVSWDDAVKFCEKLTESERSAGRLPEGWKYTLPTEAQWEYACRAGTKTQFSFGDNGSDLGDYAWFDENAWYAGEKYAHVVGQKKTNPWGLSDMHGNVWEWCSDYYAEKLAGGTDPLGPLTGSDRVSRGGSWYDNAGCCRSAFRFRYPPRGLSSYLGFRLAAVPSGK